MGVFERYTKQCKRAVFFAQQTALRGGATSIDSGHLLLGLLSEPGTRADTVFRLRELMPDEVSRQKGVLKENIVKGTIPLSLDSRRAVAYAEWEANQLRDYWIDTEHLILGLLREGTSAAKRLREVGLDLKTCRNSVIANASSRPARRDPVLWWVTRTPLGVFLQIIFLIGIIAVLMFVGFYSGK